MRREPVMAPMSGSVETLLRNSQYWRVFGIGGRIRALPKFGLRALRVWIATVVGTTPQGGGGGTEALKRFGTIITIHV